MTGPGTAVDNVLQHLRKHSERIRPGEPLARFFVTKLSWRGNYRRILAITPAAVVTYHPDTLVITNVWAFAGDFDISTVEVGGDHHDGDIFTLHFRKDKKGINARDAKFACRNRGALLALLLESAASAARSTPGITAPPFVDRGASFQAYKLRKGVWIPVSMRITSTSIERIDPETGSVKWRWPYIAAASPAAQLLASGDAPHGCAAFALLGKSGRSPRVYASRDRHSLLRAMQMAAKQRLGITFAVDSSSEGSLTGRELLIAVSAAERERAATPEESPLGEWEVLRVHDVHATAVAEHLPSSTGSAGGGLSKTVVPRRLILTQHGLLERRPATYDVAEWRQLPAIAALVRYEDDPQWLGIEWSDATPRTIYITPARDDLAAAVVYTAQTAAGRPIPLLPCPTPGSDVLVASKGQPLGAPAADVTGAGDAETEKLALHHLAAAATRFVAAGGTEMSLNALALATLTASTSTSSAPHLTSSHAFHGGLSESDDAGSEFGGGGFTAAVPLVPEQDASLVAVATSEHRIREFNASVPYSGVGAAVRVEDSVIAMLLSYLPKQHISTHGQHPPTLSIDEARLVIQALQCLQRLTTSPLVATQVVGASGGSGRVFAALSCKHEHIATEAARLLLRLFAPAASRAGAPPWPTGAEVEAGTSLQLQGPQDAARHPSSVVGAQGFSFHDDTAVARTSKSICFISDSRCGSLVGPLAHRSPSPLLSAAVIEAAVAVGCKPGARTSELATREALLREIAALGRPLFALFNHPARRVADAAALLMQTIAEGGSVAAGPMREAALEEGAVLHHLLRAMGPAGSQRKLSRDLVALWADGHDATLDLLRRIFPPGIIRYLQEPKKKVPPPRIMGPFERRSLTASTGHIIMPSSSSASNPAVPTMHAPHQDEQNNSNANEVHVGEAQQQQQRNDAAMSQSGRWSMKAPTDQNIAVPDAASAMLGSELLLQTQPPFQQPGTNPSLMLTAPGITTASRDSPHVAASAQPSHQTAAFDPLTAARSHAMPTPPLLSTSNQEADRGFQASRHLMESSQIAVQQEGLGTTAMLGEDSTGLPPARVPERLLAGRRPSDPGAASSAPQLRGNWTAFWAAVDRDHAHAALIWNERTRAELREAMQAEESLLKLGRQRVAHSGTGLPVWNAADFSVTYPSLSANLSIGGVYVRLLLDNNEGGSPEENVRLLPNPKEFFTAAHLHFLRLGSLRAGAPAAAAAAAAGAAARFWGSRSDVARWSQSDIAAEQELCVRAMTVTYAVHAADIGPFELEAMRHLVGIMDYTLRRPLRQHLLQLFQAFVAPTGAFDPTAKDDDSGGALPSSSSSSDRIAGSKPAPGSAGQTRQHAERPLNRLPHHYRRFKEENNNVNNSNNNNNNSSRVEAAVRNVAKINAAALVRAGGIQPLVDAVAAAHEASERPAAPLQTGLITSSSHAAEVKLWFYLPSNVQPFASTAAAATTATSNNVAAAADAAMAHFEQHRAGPISKAEIRQLVSRDQVTLQTPFWAAGMAEPLPLQAIRELRWWTASGQGPLSSFQAARVALRILTGLATLRPASGPGGEAVVPLPAAHREITSSGCLPHLAQAVLTGEPDLVDATSRLLVALLEHNAEAMAVLYRTGFFFFLLAYCGSNWETSARLLKLVHFRQHFRGAGDIRTTSSLAHRSFLGGLLPESLLHLLESRDAKAFAAAFSGDAETPEIIWTHRMRGQRLVPQMLRHLGDFPRRLAERWQCVYDYTPCPPVGYPELTEEIWCHRYYLRHLCDEVRFPSWPLEDHIMLLQSLLEAWRAELARKPVGLSVADAARVLGLNPDAPDGISEDDMKAAYRRLARHYHPDRNPAGRERFEEVQKAYERLQAGGTAGGGPQPWRVLLIIRAQCVLYARNAGELAGFKYAGYPLLLEAVKPMDSSNSTDAPQQQQQQQQQQHFLAPEIVSRLQAATELCWLTCAASKLNAEELARSRGVDILGDLLSRCMSVIPTDVSPTEPAAMLATQSLRAFACMAAFPSGRAEMSDKPVLIADVLKAVSLSRAPAAVDAALQCVAQMSRDAALQAALLHAGALGYLLPLLLQYDPTTQAAFKDEEDSTKDEHLSDVMPQIFDPLAEESAKGPTFLGLGVTRPNMQSAKNHHAALAARALAALAGYDGLVPPTPSNPDAKAALSGLLTPTLAPRLAERDLTPLLRDLNTTITSPHVIWSGAMREELLAAAEDLRRECGPEKLKEASGFGYTALQGELVVAGVFVRVFNEQPTFALRDPAAFCKGLVTHIHAVQRQLWAGHHLGAAIHSPPPNDHGEEVEQAAAMHHLSSSSLSSAAVAATQEQKRRQRHLKQRHLLQCLRALLDLLDTSPRLMGLLATRPALDPLISCLAPAAALGHSSPLWPRYRIPLATEDEDSLLKPSPTAATVGGGGTEQPPPPPAAARTEDVEAALLPASVYRSSGFADASAVETCAEAAGYALNGLLKLAAHAGCLEAMSTARCVTLALWIAHRPPRSQDRLSALHLLHALSASGTVASAVAEQAGWAYLLSLALPVATSTDDAVRAGQEEAALGAVAVLQRTTLHPLHGPHTVLWLGRVLPPGLVTPLKDGPAESAIAALSSSSETPERVWTLPMRRELAEELEHLASAARTSQAKAAAAVGAGGPALNWTPGAEYAVQHQGLRDELYVGGIYLRLYLKNPGYPLRNPQFFVQAALEHYVASVQAVIDSTTTTTTTTASNRAFGGESSASSAEAIDKSLLLSAAIVAAIQHHPLLADHAVALGYLPKLVRALSHTAPRLPPGDTGGSPTPDALEAAAASAPPVDDVSGSALRVLHAASESNAAGEALARCTPPAAPVLVGSMLWGGTAAVVAGETLKRGLAPSNRSRDLLVGDCLRCGLLELLLGRLDWRKGASSSPFSESSSANDAGQVVPRHGGADVEESSDAAVQRVLYVDVINLLALEGIHAERVRRILDVSDVWAAYRGQSHELFLPAGGSNAALQGGMVGLLRGSEAVRFALPAPEPHSKSESSDPGLSASVVDVATGVIHSKSEDGNGSPPGARDESLEPALPQASSAEGQLDRDAVQAVETSKTSASEPAQVDSLLETTAAAGGGAEVQTVFQETRELPADLIAGPDDDSLAPLQQQTPSRIVTSIPSATPEPRIEPKPETGGSVARPEDNDDDAVAEQATPPGTTRQSQPTAYLNTRPAVAKQVDPASSSPVSTTITTSPPVPEHQGSSTLGSSVAVPSPTGSHPASSPAPPPPPQQQQQPQVRQPSALPSLSPFKKPQRLPAATATASPAASVSPTPPLGAAVGGVAGQGSERLKQTQRHDAPQIKEQDTSALPLTDSAEKTAKDSENSPCLSRQKRSSASFVDPLLALGGSLESESD